MKFSSRSQNIRLPPSSEKAADIITACLLQAASCMLHAVEMLVEYCLLCCAMRVNWKLKVMEFGERGPAAGSLSKLE